MVQRKLSCSSLGLAARWAAQGPLALRTRRGGVLWAGLGTPLGWGT
jgi:hypothetical protein